MEILIIDHLEIVRDKPQDNFEKRVMHEFARRLGVTPKEIIEHNKKPHISEIRQLYCKLRNEMHGISYSATAREIERTHTAVIKGVKRINDLLYLKDEKVVKMWNKVKDISVLYISNDGY